MVSQEQALGDLLKAIRLDVAEGKATPSQFILASWIEGIRANYEREFNGYLLEQARVAHGLRYKNTEIRIKHADLRSFTEEHTLDYDEIVRVSNGEIPEYKGYSRARTLSSIQGSPFRKAWEATPEVKARLDDEKPKGFFRKKKPEPLQPEAIKTVDYTPKGKA